MNPVFILLIAAAAVFSVPAFAAEGEWESMNLEIARLYSLGDFESAVRLAEQSLARAKSEFGPSHLNTAKALNNLANLYFRTGRPDEAGWLYEDALGVEENALGRESKSVADTLYNFSMLHLYLGQKDKARVKLERARAIYKAQTPPDPAALERVEKALLHTAETQEEAPV